MSTVLSTMANALIEFILSLLRDPDAAEEFDQQPEAALAGAGLADVSYDDLCAVMPLIYDNPQVVQRGVDPAPASTSTPQPPPGPFTEPTPQVISELRDVINNNSYVTTTNNATVVDQSVNQNIWAEGDVMQLFDNEAVVATGQDSSAAGRDIVDDRSQDSSTTIVAGRDAVVDNQTDVSTVAGSYNETTDNSTNTGTSPAAATPADAVTAAGDTTAAAEAPASTPAPEPVTEPAADPLSDPYADPGVDTVAEPEAYDEPLTDDDY